MMNLKYCALPIIVMASICFFCIIILNYKHNKKNIYIDSCNIYKKYEEGQSEYILFKKICDVNKINEKDIKTIYLFITFSLLLLFGHAMLQVNKNM